MYYLAIAFVIAIIILYFYRRGKKEGLATDARAVSDIIIAFDKVQRNLGSINEFRAEIRDPTFSPYKYAQMMTLYKNKILTLPNATAILHHSTAVPK